MKKKIPLAYFMIIFLLLTLMSLPKKSTENLRGSAVGIITPTWTHLFAFANFFSPSHLNEKKESLESSQQLVQKLNLENTLLRTEITRLKDILHHENVLVQQLQRQQEDLSDHPNPNTPQQREEFQKLLKSLIQALPARVIFRSPAAWSNTLWINIGKSSNADLDCPIVAKNSPVLAGNAIIGLIDYVNNHQARVRLITDATLTPSVRALRDPTHTGLLKEKIQTLIRLIYNSPGALKTKQQETLLENLEIAADLLTQEPIGTLLAKGELHGSSKPLWRSQRYILNGVGFNYDYADGEGPARDLRNGKPIEADMNGLAIPILRNKDVLVTTGMDGIFPPHLLVAEVTKIHMLKEGDYYYELEAMPAAGNFDDIEQVFVLPPVCNDADETPLLKGWK